MTRTSGGSGWISAGGIWWKSLTRDILITAFNQVALAAFLTVGKEWAEIDSQGKMSQAILKIV
jgi:hypothetical protein